MARSGRSSTDRVEQLLNLIQSEGLEHEVARGLSHRHDSPPSSEFAFVMGEMETGGTMSDAAKRRADASEAPPSCRQRPLPPVPKQILSTDLEFPPGISSMEEWGSTILTTGKYGKDDSTYEEVSSHPEKVKYCNWLVSAKRDEFHVQLQDFAQYLIMKRAVAPQSSAPCYPGSSLVRKMRPPQ